VVLDHHQAPEPEELAKALDRARGRGAVRARTSALFPTATPVFLAAGFTPIDTLALLRCDLTGAGSDAPGDATSTDPLVRLRSGRPVGPTPRRRRSDRGATPGTAGSETVPGPDTGTDTDTDTDTVPEFRIRPLRRRHHRIAAEIDLRAFGAPWANDARSLGEIRHATPIHRATRAVVGWRTTGFAITGLAGDTGYLQRLAVDPDHHRLGIGAALVADALDWVRRCGADTVMVNTGIENHAALALYRGFSFREVAQRLTIAELRLDPGTGDGSTVPTGKRGRGTGP
jgi:ribosomal protein S18 acetylase RimI-like enzyme